MERKIQWESGLLDEIELVYEKADKEENLGKQLSTLEEQALSEARANCGKGGLPEAAVGAVLTPEQFDGMSDTDKETAIKFLAGLGLADFGADYANAVIKVRFSARIPKVQACTIFDVLNRLEKLDGAITIVHPKWTLALQVPLGGKKGLFQWEMLIMQLYPWLSIREESSNEVAEGTLENSQDSDDSIPKAEKPPQKPTEQSKDSIGADAFLQAMQGNTSFTQAFQLAEKEVKEALGSGVISLKKNGLNLTAERFGDLTRLDKLNFILSLGNHGITRSALLCIDFSETIPYCIAMMLLYGAYTGQMTKQVIDAGDGAKVDRLVEALTLLHSCCDSWECTIMSPIVVKIGREKSASPGREEDKKSNIPERKEPFWKKLFKK